MKTTRTITDKATDPWATPWPQTLVTPVFVGGPADGHSDAPRPHCELPLQIQVPVAKGIKALAAAFDDDINAALEAPPFDAHIYRLGPYRDAFTVEYR